VQLIKKERQGALRAGIITAAVSFALFFSAIRFVLGSVPNGWNVMAYLGLAVIFGILSYVLFMLRPRVAFYIFEAGLLSGFALMCGMFKNGMTGWSDLAGIMTFFIFVTGGLASGLFVQLIIYFVQRRKYHMK